MDVDTDWKVYVIIPVLKEVTCSVSIDIKSYSNISLSAKTYTVSEQKREELYMVITEKALAWSIGMVDNETIDRINILQATKQAMTEAAKKADDMLVTATEAHIDMLLLDAVHLEDMDIQQESIIKGDAQSLSIAAASILSLIHI